MKINFHMHSKYSDGRLSVPEVANIARQFNYNMVALTDHDTIDGVNEMMEECRKIGITAISGVEITSFVPQELGIYDDTYKIHILGLNFEIDKMRRVILDNNARRDNYHFNTLLNLGIESTTIDNNMVSNRIYCAELLVKNGLFPTIDEALVAFHTSEYTPTIEKVIKDIHQAGGVAIWAHPYILPRNGGFRIDSNTVKRIAEFFVKLGIDGLEGYYLQFSDEEQSFIASFCKDNNLFCSTGTDFHGDYPWEEELLKINGETDSLFIETLSKENGFI